MNLIVRLSIRTKVIFNSFRKAIRVKMVCSKSLQNKICIYAWSYLKKAK